MRIGWHSHVQQRDPSRSVADQYAEYLSEVELAEELGFDEAWFTEHHFHPYGMLPSPNLFLASLAARTERIRIGNMVNVLPLYDPVRLAEEFTMLDHLSRGRLNLGLGSGIRPDEFAPYVIPMGESKPRYYEAFDIIVKALSAGERWDYDGEFNEYIGVSILPKPLQQPYPPICVAAQSPDSVRWCAERGIPIAQQYFDRERTRLSVGGYREMASAAAKRGTKFLGTPSVRQFRAVYVAENDDDALAEGEAGFYQFFRYFAHLPSTEKFPEPSDDGWRYYFGTALAWIGELLFEDLDRENLIVCGSPERVRSKIRELDEDCGGLETFVGMFTFGHLSHEQVCRSMTLFAREVAPTLRDTSATAGSS